MRKKLLAVVMAACMIFGTAAALPQAFFSDTYITASAEYFESSDFGYYVQEDSTLTVARYIGNGGDVKIPKTVQGKTVTNMQSGVFYNNDTVTSITIPDSITTIYESSICQCRKVKKITLPATLKKIGYNAFGSCTSLESIDIPEGVTSIGNVAFNNCVKLRSITLPSTLEELGTVTFQNCISLKSITIPRKITKIDTAVFVDCTGLESVTLPDGLKTIESSAFNNCKSLKSITLPSGLEEINGYAFFNCAAMKSVTIPEGLRRFGDRMFGYYAKEVNGKEETVKIPDFRIYGGVRTIAEKYAKGEGFEFVARMAGSNRFDTAARISKSMRSKPTAVFLANGMNYADALAGVPIAKALNAPILLTETDKLPAETLAELKRLDVKNVIMLGGEGAISENVDKTLEKNGFKTGRIAGDDRFETAIEIANKLNPSPSEVFFVYGLNYADALSIGAVAGFDSAPIIYLKTNGDIDKATKDYLAGLKKQGCVANAYVIGGEGVISDAMMKQAGDLLGVKPERVSGADRYATCTEVNKKFAGVFKGKTVCIAKGLNFPDALAGGVLAASSQAPILLADNTLQSSHKEYLKQKKANAFYVFGGTGAVSDKLVNEVAGASK